MCSCRIPQLFFHRYPCRKIGLCLCLFSQCAFCWVSTPRVESEDVFCPRLLPSLIWDLEVWADYYITALELDGMRYRQSSCFQVL